MADNKEGARGVRESQAQGRAGAGSVLNQQPCGSLPIPLPLHLPSPPKPVRDPSPTPDARAQQHAVADGWVAHAVAGAAAPQGDLVQHRHVVAHHRRLTNHDA